MSGAPTANGAAAAPASAVNPATMTRFETEKGLKQVADWVRRRSGGMRLRHAIELEKRVEYFKGEKLIKYLVENKVKGMPPIKDEAEADYVCKALLRHDYFHRSQKSSEKGFLEMSRDQTFEPTGYYTWIYQGSQTLSHLMTALIIIGFLTVTCFPIWPQFLKVCMWYLSVTLLIFMLTFLTLRALIWLGLWVCGYEFWILPRLFDESLNFCESFVPVWSWEKVPDGQGYYRTTVFIGFIAFCVWAWSQPTDFDSFLAAQKDFVADLYEGNLLTDVSQESKENIDKPRMQSLEDILKSLDEEDNVPEEDGDNLIDKLLDSEFADDDHLDALDEQDAQDDESTEQHPHKSEF